MKTILILCSTATILLCSSCLTFIPVDPMNGNPSCKMMPYPEKCYAQSQSNCKGCTQACCKGCKKSSRVNATK